MINKLVIDETKDSFLYEKEVEKLEYIILKIKHVKKSEKNEKLYPFVAECVNCFEEKINHWWLYNG